jgi:UDP-glucose 4-epimerase
MASDLVLVTGGAGFVGSHLVEALVAHGETVLSLDDYSTGSEANHVAGAEYRHGSTRDIRDLVTEQPALVYHLGEYSRVEQSFAEPDTVWRQNTHGTQAVLEFCRERGCKIVYAGSSTKFADGGVGRNQSPYAWSKAANTELVVNYGAWYGVPYAITYFYNVYGPREIRTGPYATVIGVFSECRAGGQPLPVREPGSQRRNFTHVDDIVDGLLRVGDRGEGDEYGLGAPDSFSIEEVAQLFGGEIEWLPERPGNRMDAVVDTARARLELDWSPAHDLPTFIKELTDSAG